MKSLLKVYALVSLSVMCVACCNQPAPQSQIEEPDIQHVVMIGMDGLAGHLVEAADMPTMKQMMAQGAWTLRSRSALPSVSAVNWASAYMGVSTDMHGYLQWGSRVPDFEPAEVGENGITPTIFTALRRYDATKRTSAFFEWDVHACLIDSVAVSAFYHIPMRDGHSEDLTAAFIEEITQQKPLFTMAIYDSPDVEGHEFGWGSPEYMARLTVLDSHIAEIVEATKSAGIYDKTLFILVADHGGIDKGHGRTTPEEMNAPLVFVGPGVKQGYEIESAVMRYDLAPTIAHILGAEAPEVWRGKALTQIFE